MADNKALLTIDSLRLKQIENFKLISNSYENQIDILNKQIKTKEKNLLMWKIGGITVGTSLLLFLILK